MSGRAAAATVAAGQRRQSLLEAAAAAAQAAAARDGLALARAATEARRAPRQARSAEESLAFRLESGCGRVAAAACTSYGPGSWLPEPMPLARHRLMSLPLSAISSEFQTQSDEAAAAGLPPPWTIHELDHALQVGMGATLILFYSPLPR